MIEPFSPRLELLYRISQTINSSLDLDVVMETLMDEVISATKAERVFLMLLNETGELEFRTARGMDQRTIEESDFKISRSIVERVAAESSPLLTSNAQLDQRFGARESVKLYGLRSVLCVPIIQKNQTLGVIYVDNRFQNGIFSQNDLELLTSIASSAGIAIDNARLYRIAVEKGRMERELRSGPGIGIALIALGESSRSQSDYAAARDYYEEALYLNERLGQLGIVNIVAHNLGYVARQQGDLDKALEFFWKSLAMSLERDQRRFIFFCLSGIACVLVDQGAYENAARLFGFSEKYGQDHNYHFDPVDLWEVEQSIKKLDAEMNDNERQDCWKSGKNMTLEEAIQIAKGDHEN